MTLQERIAGLERDLQEAKNQVSEWTQTGLRIEGGLLILHKMLDEEQKENPPVPDNER